MNQPTQLKAGAATLRRAISLAARSIRRRFTDWVCDDHDGAGVQCSRRCEPELREIVPESINDAVFLLPDDLQAVVASAASRMEELENERRLRDYQASHWKTLRWMTK